MATPNIVPIVDGQGGIGTSSKGWGDSYFTGNLEIQSGSSSTLSKISIGTDSNKATIGVSGGVSTFFTDTAAGDLVLRADDNNNKVHIGAGTSGIAGMVVTEVSNVGKVGIGTHAPGVQLEVLDVTATSATQGGNLRLTADDNAVMGDNHRLGVIEFAGAEDAGSGAGLNTHSVGARIEAIARDAWDGSNNDADLLFYTTDGTTQAKVLTLDADKNATFAGAVKSNAAVTGLNYRTIYIDAGSMVPSATNGAQAATEEMHATNFTTMDYFAFDKATEEYVDFKMVMPLQYDYGTIKAKFYWKPSDAEASVSVIWGIKAYVAHDSTLLAPGSGVWGTAVEIEDLSLNVDDDLHISPTTAAMTVAGTPAADGLIFFRVYRKAADGTDDYDADAHLLGVNIQYRESSTAVAAWS